MNSLTITFFYKLRNKMSLVVVLTSSILFTASSFAEDETDDDISRIPITVVASRLEDVEKKIRVQGDIDTSTQPVIAAEVAAKVEAMKVGEGTSVVKGQVLAVLDSELFLIAQEKAHAEIQRIEALIENQKRLLDRNRKLYRDRLLSQNAFEASETALSLSEADLIVFKARLKDTEFKLRHVQITSPIDAVVQTKLVSTGDYLKVGKGVYKLISLNDIYARLFFPETLAGVVKTPTTVTLYHGKESLTATLTNFRPMLEKGNRSIHGLVVFENSLNWKPGYSVIGEVSLEVHKDAVMVPLQAVVRRPAGLVVYLIEDNQAKEVAVTTGLIEGANIEVLSGLKSDQIIALDGAPFLSDGATVSVKQMANLQNIEDSP